MKKIGERVRVLREIRNLSQENMSDELKMSQQGYSRIERGDKEIKIARLEQIAKILGVKVEDILTLEDGMLFNIHHNPNSNNGLVIIYGSSDEESKERVSLLEKEITLLKEKCEMLKQLKGLSVAS